MNILHLKPDHSEIARDGLILALWRQGKDTSDIAAALRMRTPDVANRLARLRDAVHDA